MSVFWQHVGQANSDRDFPRTIGTSKHGLKEFRLVDIEPYLSYLDGIEKAENQRAFSRIGNSAFQIWGFPAGAEAVLTKLNVGDYLLLLDTNAAWGGFRYGGRVIHRLPNKQWDLSNHLWKDSKYPVITLLRGQLINYAWSKFLEDMKYGSGLKPMGRTYRISEDALARAGYQSDQQFFDHVMTYAPSNSTMSD